MSKQILIVALLLCSAALSLAAGYVEDRAAAANLVRKRQHEQALEAFTKLSGMEGISDFQKSDALEQAAACARTLRKYDLAAELAEQIPIEAVAKSVRMRNLAAQGKYKELVEEFKDEKLETWPEYASVHAYRARGQAYYVVGEGEAAEEDLSRAASIMTGDTSESAARLWLMLALNRERNLKDNEKAWEAYRKIILMLRRRGGAAGHLSGALQAARFLREQGKYEEALEAVRLMRPHKRRGFWHGRALCSLGETLAEMGRKDEAVAAYREVLEDDKVHRGDRKKAEEAIDGLTAAQE